MSLIEYLAKVDPVYKTVEQIRAGYKRAGEFSLEDVSEPACASRDVAGVVDKLAHRLHEERQLFHNQNFLGSNDTSHLATHYDAEVLLGRHLWKYYHVYRQGYDAPDAVRYELQHRAIHNAQNGIPDCWESAQWKLVDDCVKQAAYIAGENTFHDKGAWWIALAGSRFHEAHKFVTKTPDSYTGVLLDISELMGIITSVPGLSKCLGYSLGSAVPPEDAEMLLAAMIGRPDNKSLDPRGPSDRFKLDISAIRSRVGADNRTRALEIYAMIGLASIGFGTFDWSF